MKSEESKFFSRLDISADVSELSQRLKDMPELFGRISARKYAAGSPHSGMTDIWVRYNDYRPFAESGDWSRINDPHESVWYPDSFEIPQARDIAMKLMAHVGGERLGGILITKIPPGGVIELHTDHGWHAGYYDKYYVAIDNAERSIFIFPDGHFEAKKGDVYWFRNDVQHAVINGSDRDRVAMIVCIRTNKGRAWE